MLRFLKITLRFALVGVLAAACSPDEVAPATPAVDGHLAMGNPSGAVADVSQPSNYLLTKPQYIVSYHRDKGIPNWVSWHLAASWLGRPPG
jgi:endonuclease G